MLKAVEVTSENTLHMADEIQNAMLEFKHQIRSQLPKIYSQDLISNLFRHPYTKIESIQRELLVSRLTATKYLDKLVAGAFLEKHKIGRYNYYINRRLFELCLDPP